MIRVNKVKEGSWKGLMKETHGWGFVAKHIKRPRGVVTSIKNANI